MKNPPFTESQIRQLIDGLSVSHILKQSPDAYVQGFIEAALGVYEPEKLDEILQQKFFIPVESGYSERYYQAASELTVAWDLKRKEQRCLVENCTHQESTDAADHFNGAAT